MLSHIVSQMPQRVSEEHTAASRRASRQEDTPIELVEVIWLHGCASGLGDYPPVQLLVLGDQIRELRRIIYLKPRRSAV